MESLWRQIVKALHLITLNTPDRLLMFISPTSILASTWAIPMVALSAATKGPDEQLYPGFLNFVLSWSILEPGNFYSNLKYTAELIYNATQKISRGQKLDWSEIFRMTFFSIKNGIYLRRKRVNTAVNRTLKQQI